MIPSYDYLLLINLIIIVVVIFLLLFLVGRWFALWYWRVNELVNAVKSIEYILRCQEQRYEAERANKKQT